MQFKHTVHLLWAISYIIIKNAAFILHTEKWDTRYIKTLPNKNLIILYWGLQMMTNTTKSSFPTWIYKCPTVADIFLCRVWYLSQTLTSKILEQNETVLINSLLVIRLHLNENIIRCGSTAIQAVHILLSELSFKKTKFYIHKIAEYLFKMSVWHKS